MRSRKGREVSENQGVCGKWRSIFRRKNAKWLFYLLIPASILIGIKVFQDRAYIWISLWISLLSAVPFFLAFERRKANTKRMLLLSVLTALSVLGRFVFAPLPHFKPVTAMVVLTGMYLGAESGFLCGALTAILSNILFGQGPWTPFQMMTWGIIGLLSALFSRWLQKSRWFLAGFGALAGVLFSFIMDVWTVFGFGDGFSLPRYWAAVAAAPPVTAVYAGSNVVFLLVLAKPIGEKIRRVIEKYGV